MRENIGLFKAKDIETRDWREGCLIIDGTPNARKYYIQTIPSKTNPLSDIYEVDPETLCECVGLRDKNGKLIFENDEIYFLDGMSTENGFDDFNNTGFVKWSEEEARFYVADRESVSSEDALNYCTIISNKFEEVESENI